MIERMRNKAGFTLAELMMSIAIVLILAAVALPSVVTAQNNMRMVELNNAAQSIANAAQAQMTSMKVSGTWMAFLDARSTRPNDPQATNYLVRDEAQSAGIITSLSIDETVYEGDYVIVFDRDTASVTEVYYADGKSGFFGETAASTNAARDYYLNEGASTDQAVRMKHDPMIGYYAGTPAGATSAVALSNPVIWVDDRTELKGLLCVQDPNVTKHPEWKSETELVISKTDAEGNTVSFSIGGLDGTAAHTVSAWVDQGEQTDYRSYTSDASSKPILQRIDRDGNAGGDVYAIDLNALVRAVGADASQGAAALLAELQKFSPGDTVRVDATVSTANPPSVDAHASANIEWPTQVAKLSVFVTNPNSNDVGEKPDHITGTYADPSFNTVAEDGSDALEKIHVPDSVDNELTALNVNQSLSAENAQAMAQSYAGAWVDMGQASRIKASLRATAGAYKPNANTTHQYQVWELWVKQSNSEYTRAGYMRDNVWEWYDYAALGDCITWHKADGTSVKGNIAGTNAQGVVSITVDVQALQAKLATELSNLVDDTGSVEIYLRTAPKASEVQEYFNAKAAVTEQTGSLAADYLSNNETESASRRTNGTASAQARAVFENEFGASSSDVAWAVSREAKSGDFAQANDFLAEGTNIRVYYSIAPGIGFKNIKEFQNGNLPSILSSVRSTQMTNVALWLYRSDEAGVLKAMPEAMLISDGNSPYTCRHGNDAANNNLYDFKLTTQEDYRFYRVLTYYGDAKDAEDSPIKLGIPSQYVPHVSADDENIATIAAAENYEDDENIYAFDYWTTRDVTEGDPLELKSGGKVSDYDKLSYSGTTLLAHYKSTKKAKPSIGMMYIETGKDKEGNTAYGYYGYIGGAEENGDSSRSALLSNDYALHDGGYYIVVPSGSSTPVVTNNGGLQNTSFSETITIPIEGSSYDCYRLYASIKDVGGTRMLDKFKKQNYTLSVKSSMNTGTETKVVTGTYTINLAFACAVTTNTDIAIQWGQSETSPWIVRLGRQFIGCLGSNGGSSVQETYASENHFRQTHDIDLSDAPVNGVSRFKWTFDRSSYNAMGLDGKTIQSIFGIEHRLQEENADGEVDGYSGLFCKVKNSTISNLKIVVSGGSEESPYRIKSGNSLLRFGLLVGSGERVTVANCSIEEKAGEPAYFTVVRNPGYTKSGEDFSAGLLFGYSEELTLSNCSISGVHVRIERADSWTVSSSCGFVAGYNKTSANLSNCAVKNSSIGLAASTTQNMYFGGLVGYVDYFLGCSNCSFVDTQFTVPDDQPESGVVAGALVGKIGWYMQSSNNTAANMAVVYGSVAHPLESERGDL